MVCESGKVTFSTRKHAKSYLKRKPALWRNRVYLCPTCGFFHHTRADAKARAYHREHRAS